MAELYIKKDKKGYVSNMHPWVSSDAFVNIPNINIPIIDIFDEKNKFIARCLFNKKSKIPAKILTYNKKENIDQKFFDKKIKLAFGKRKNLSVFRAFNTEGDGIPGLIIDVFDDIVVYEIYSLALTSFEKMILQSIQNIIKPKYIAKVGKSIFRSLENLDFFNIKWIGSKPKNIIITENDLMYSLDLNYPFVIQRENRIALRGFAKDMNVLTLFCNNNGLIIPIKQSYPAKITSIDMNDFTNVLVSYELNKFKKGKDIFLTGDIYQNLNKVIKKNEKFDLIVIDYPDFIKSQKESIRYMYNITSTITSCINMLSDFGNIIFTTNSGFISSNDFFAIMKKVTEKSKIQMQIFYRVSQPYDYPSLTSMPESNFFNCIWAQRV